MGRYKNNKNKTDNYAITFKIDADIDDFLKNIEVVTFIETMKVGEIESITKTTYVNKLIREDMLRIFKENNVSTWEDYKEKFSIKENGR